MVAVQDGNARIVLTDADLKLNFKATFSEEVTKFTIEVDDEFLRTTKLKASLTRLPMDLEQQPEQADGPPRRVGEKVARYWADEYDWRQVEADLNRRFEQFTTIVRTGTSSSEFPAAEPVPLHFVHHRSPRADALPLLFMHGWPGSFLEVEHILEPLVRPERDDLPAFHVVAPSIPGYGFSPSPRRPGMGYRATAAAFHALMQKLGYERFVWQGGVSNSQLSSSACWGRFRHSGCSVPPFQVWLETHTPVMQLGKKLTSETYRTLVTLSGDS